MSDEWFGNWGGYPVVVFGIGESDYYYDYPPPYDSAQPPVYNPSRAAFIMPTVNYVPKRTTQPREDGNSQRPAPNNHFSPEHPKDKNG